MQKEKVLPQDEVLPLGGTVTQTRRVAVVMRARLLSGLGCFPFTAAMMDLHSDDAACILIP